MFDALFENVYYNDRKVVMRAMDAIEKITLNAPHFLHVHKAAIWSLFKTAKDKELKRHLVLLVPRLQWQDEEWAFLWDVLTHWALDKKESRIVRVNAIQALSDLLPQHPELAQDFHWTLTEIAKEQTPSINARIRKINHSK